jgi:hypothetical protein
MFPLAFPSKAVVGLGSKIKPYLGSVREVTVLAAEALVSLHSALVYHLTMCKLVPIYPALAPSPLIVWQTPPAVSKEVVSFLILKQTP